MTKYIKEIFFTAIFLCSLKTYGQLQDHTDVQITNSAISHVENSIAINPTNSQNIIISSTASNHQISHYYTINGGTSWSVSDNTPNDATSFCNSVSFFDYNGNAFLAFLNGNNNISLMKTTNGGTTLNMYDIYGAYNASSKQWEILAVASQNLPAGHAIFSINGNTATQISSNPIDEVEEYFGVWFMPCEQYYVIGDGIYRKNLLSDTAWRNNPLDITHYATTKIRGNAVNDVIVGGSYGELLHYNGSTWKSFISEVGLGSNGVYGSVAIKNNLVIAVGENNPLAAIAIGRR